MRFPGIAGFGCRTFTPVPQGPLLLDTNPLLQGAQVRHPVRGLPPPLLTATGARHSLLGPAPLGLITGPYQPHSHKDVPERKRERENARGTDGQPRYSTTKEECGDEAAHASESNGPPSLQQHELLKRQRRNGLEEPVCEEDSERATEDRTPTEGVEPAAGFPEPRAGPGGLSAEECSDSNQPAEVSGQSLKVTIQRSSENRAFSTGLEEPAGAAAPSTGQEEDSATPGRHYCHLCKIPCGNQQGFQSHMISVGHQQRVTDVQHRSSASLDCLLRQTHTTQPGNQANRGRGKAVQFWCATCQSHFRGDLILHRRTQQHKLCKQSSRPFCPVCQRHFRTPRRFVEHMKSPEHKEQVKQLRQEEEPDVLEEELITLDAVGCFEGEEDYEEEPQEEEADSRKGQSIPIELSVAKDIKDAQEDTLNGSSFVVPVSGFLCRLCHKFFHLESTASLSHCSSPAHLLNLQRYNALRTEMSSTGEDSDAHSQPGGKSTDQRPVLTSEDEAEPSDSPGSCLIPDLRDFDDTVSTAPGSAAPGQDVRASPWETGQIDNEARQGVAGGGGGDGTRVGGGLDTPHL